MGASLKSFIKSIRGSKTIADERAIIKRESAAIRTAFKDTSLSHNSRRVAIQKLLYLYILGEKTHFGQIECIKLLASPNFIDKRLGYLATMLILDENQEVLTLLTNSLNNDLNHPNNFIVALALSALGNIASPELARDLYPDVEKIISCNNNYLKKKAAMVASKIVEKDPDLYEIFLAKVDDLLDSPDHGNLLGVLKLIRNMYEFAPESRDVLLLKIPTIIHVLKTLLSKNINQEFDLLGVHDPFLQISIIRSLRLFFTDDAKSHATAKYNDALNDILTKVASSTDFNKNAGASVSYECVKTIFSIKEIDPALKILGINILGKLLATKDNNNRYVALDTLLAVVDIEPLAVQRHRNTIILCLQDQDISIKRRALELSFAILDSSNIRILIKEILNFLENPVNNDKNLINYITTNVVNVLEKQELIPNEKWRFDTLIRLLNYSNHDDTLDINTSIISQILILIINISDLDLQKYVVVKIFSSSLQNFQLKTLNIVNLWLVGEFTNYLLNSKIVIDNEEKIINETTLINYLFEITNENSNDVNNNNNSNIIVSYALTCALKLSVKIRDSSNLKLLKKFISSKKTDINLNIQIKAINYSSLFNEPTDIKLKVLDSLPKPKIISKENISLTNRHVNKMSVSGAGSTSTGSNTSHNKTEDLLLDLMDDFTPESQSKAQTGGDNSNTAADLLGDIFNKPKDSKEILGLFDNNNNTISSSSSSSSNVSPIEGFADDKAEISFLVKSIGSGEARIETIIKNKTAHEISNLHLLIAVPKQQKLTMSPISSQVIGSNSQVYQEFKIVGAAGSKIKLRVKFDFVVDNQSISHQFDFSKITQLL